MHELSEIELERVGERLARYRVLPQDAVRRMRESLLSHGQLSPVVCFCDDGDTPELVDGFKRLRAARELTSIAKLLVRFIPGDERVAMAAMLTLNRMSGRTCELEEARVVQSLVREHGLSQGEVAELLFRHKSWVSRRLALLERLCGDAQEMLAVGLLSPTAARELNRLPAGNQSELVDVARREALTGAELKSVVDALASCETSEQRAFVLEHPREATTRGERAAYAVHDPRLSPMGNRLAKRLARLRDLLGEVEGSLSVQTEGLLTSRDALLLEEPAVEVGSACRSLAEAVDDFTAREKRR